MSDFADLTSEAVRQHLHAVEDPELGLSIVDLGLVRGVDLDRPARSVYVRLTLTSPFCPMGPELLAAVKGRVLELPGVQRVDVELVWSPPWYPRTDASDEVKAMLGIWD
jgi:metal-sulfur cluster biosynthetic enzyme